MGEQGREKESMKHVCAGLLAHVDAGKTTLSEAMLYVSGRLRKLGRVDHRDAFLDTDAQERERGITIFSKQAILPLPSMEMTLLDTPGHVDFSSEMERTLQILDYAILVISGTDGVQSHTRTLWKLLEEYGIPVFLFVNKMDLAGTDREKLIEELQNRLSPSCVEMENLTEKSWEEIAMCDEDTLSSYLETGSISEGEIRRLIWERKLFPCYFGSALKLQGVEALLQGFEKYMQMPSYAQSFGAKVYKVARDPQGARLTYMKITGGSLRVKTVITEEEKVDQIRMYSGSKFQIVEEAAAGTVCAVTGLIKTRPGQGLGVEPDSEGPVMESILTYQVELPSEVDPFQALQKLRQLEEEDPQLHVVWNEQLREVHMQLMGEVQLEVLQRLIFDRFGWKVRFGTGNIVYRETIRGAVEGVGHYEPLRHYAEVHLLLEAGESGSGLQLDTACSEDVLAGSWQHLILSHLEEKTFLGVLTGSPITDMKITLLTGRAHIKHTEGGDFREATYRAVRNGLMKAESILLEPWYEFRLEVPAAQIGRALSDLQKRSAQFEDPEREEDRAIITGSAPVASFHDYALEVTAYTKGLGQLSCGLKGYAPCHNPEEVIQRIGYDAERDLQNTADSVFCAHGAGFVVKWDQVEEYMHLPSGWKAQKKESAGTRSTRRVESPHQVQDTMALDKELREIFERTYGPIQTRAIQPRKDPSIVRKAEGSRMREIRPLSEVKEYLLVDGYNILYAWDELKKLAQENMDAARQRLMDMLCNYQGYKKCVCILVFDAYKVPGGTENVVQYHNIHVVYTKEAETADTYIERTAYELGKEHQVRVATSDAAEQMIVLGHGALRLSADEFREEVLGVQEQIRQVLREKNRKEKNPALGQALKKFSNS
ncbi:MAG: NYN domain-containing protein [Lachnospirales bacterium]